MNGLPRTDIQFGTQILALYEAVIEIGTPRVGVEPRVPINST